MIHASVGCAKTNFFLALIGWLFLLANLAHGHNGAVAIALPLREITVDGDLSDWPEGLEVYPIEWNEHGDSPTSHHDFRGVFRIGHDKEKKALYVCVEVTDDSSDFEGNLSGVGDARDGCEIFVDKDHLKEGDNTGKYAQYVADLETNGVRSGAKEVELKVKRLNSKRVYEWCIKLDDAFAIGRSIGFDVTVPDKDADGSFTQTSWGSGAQKHESATRCGDVLFVESKEMLGKVSGTLTRTDNLKGRLPLIRIESVQRQDLWTQVESDPAGRYAANLPAGDFVIQAADTANSLNVMQSRDVGVQVQAGVCTEANSLLFARAPRPEFEGGVLLQPGVVDSNLIDRFPRAYVEYYKIPGLSLAIVKDSKLVYQGSFGVRHATTREPVKDDTLFEAASMTKPLLAYAVCRLAERGIIDLDAPLYKYQEQTPGYEDIAQDERHKLITARTVLTHRTGFPNWRTGNLKIEFTPGLKRQYSGEGFGYLGSVVAHLTGKDLATVVEEEVFQPLGIKNAHLAWNEHLANQIAYGHISGNHPIPKRKVAAPNMAFSLDIDAGNYANFLIGVLRRKGMKQASYDDMLSRQFGENYGLGMRVDANTKYGTKYSHSGSNLGYTSNFAIFDDKKIAYVFLINNEEGDRFKRVLESFLMTGDSKKGSLAEESQEAAAEAVDPLEQAFPPSLSAADWQADLRFLQRTIHEDYPFLLRKISKDQFDGLVEELNETIPELSQHEIIVGFARIVSAFGYGHSSLRWDEGPATFHRLPVQLYHFNDGVHIQGVHKDYSDALGAKVVKIEGIPIEDALTMIRPVVPIENEQYFKAHGVDYMCIPEVLHAQRITSELKSRITFTLEKEGRTFDCSFLAQPSAFGPRSKYGFLQQSADWLDARDQSATPYYLRHLDKIYYFVYLPESKTVYIRHSQIQDDPEEPVPAFYGRVFEFINGNDVERLVLDLRLNGGGENAKNLPIVKGIVRCEKIDQPGRFVVIVGRNTFSACQNLVNELDKYTDAILVGEPSSENVNFYGDARRVELPASKIPVFLSYAWWQDKPHWDASPWTAPQIAVDISSQDYASNQDPVLTAALCVTDGDLLSDPIGHLTRRVLNNEKDQLAAYLAAFVSDPRFRYVNLEADIRKAGNSLYFDSHQEDGLFLWQLNTTLYPKSAHALLHLGGGFELSGETKKAIECYARAIEVDQNGEVSAKARQMMEKLRAK